MQTHYSDTLADQKKECLHQLEKWSLIEENALQKMSRATWIRLGDSNNKYFTAIMKEKQTQKQILEINSLTGATPSLPAVNRLDMRNGPCLSHAQQTELCANVTESEIYDRLNAIGDCKAPRIDGFNALFFKRSLPIIKKDVCEAVKEFFDTGIIDRAINCTTLTLLPKVANQIQYYRLISCCTVLYKLISKVITRRMQKVMSHIISDSQAGFIPVRRITDNIILAHKLVKSYNRKHISPRCMIKVDLRRLMTL
ncbi:PREDICTED: uncharacterized protein LOC109231502 [Nicotiana attenuata]|uniref:uncharacterized protein LOC109231502 n=1 Tax=Nicotiana attenuata TaxID=49451 RepID=UPI000904E2FC|nr:PREDICTED: uncharacterized protein LOC109231502 [Nicotiana attenuata]